jgi:hypothetical protein
MGSIFDLEIGEYVEISFYDHSHDVSSKGTEHDLLNCRARGRIIALNPDRIVLQTWETDTIHDKDYEDNQEVFTIACRLITEYQTFIPWKKVKLY